MLLASACTQRFGDSEGKMIFRYNESSGITSLDPAFSRDQATNWVCNHLYNSLLQLDSNLNVRPSLAKSWTVSPDGLLYTLVFRHDVRFHDNECFKDGIGRVVTAYDAEYSLHRLLDPSLNSPGSWVMGPVERKNGFPSIHASNDTVLTIRLTEPFPPFPGLLAMQYCSVIPVEAVEYYGRDFRSHPVGTGPFRFGMWKEGVKLVLLKNADYFEFDGDKRLPFLDAVSITFLVDKQTAFLEFVKGSLDFMSGLDGSYKDEILTPSGRLNPKYDDRINLITEPYLNTEYLGIVMDSSNPAIKGNPLVSKKIRQAVSYGFDRKKMIRYLRNNVGTPGTRGFIPRGLPGFCDSAGYGYEYNPERTRSLLSEAGFPDGKGLPEIVLSTNASYLDLCQFIQEQLSQSGIRMRIDVSPPATLKENIAQSRIPFFRGSWIADYPDAENYLSLFLSSNHTPAGPNYTLFKSAAFDRTYRKAVGETDDLRRIALYREMDSLVMAEAPVVVLFYDQVLRFTGKQVKGLGSNPLNLLDLRRVTINVNRN